MSHHPITLEWSRSSPSFDYERYNRAHTVTFKNGQSVNMSAAVAYRGDADMVDPEEAFVASIASCHMLTFLAIASRRGFVVDSYRDEAVGHLEKNAEGRLAITRVELRPRIQFGAPGNFGTSDNAARPDEATLREMHEKAHDQCFIANSVRTEVSIA